MLRKIFGGDSSAELILLIRPKSERKKTLKKKKENVARGKLTIPTDYFPWKSEPPHPLFAASGLYI